MLALVFFLPFFVKIGVDLMAGFESCCGHVIRLLVTLGKAGYLGTPMLPPPPVTG